MRGNGQAKKRVRKPRPRRANRGIKATLVSLLTSEKQFDRTDADLEGLDREVLVLLQRKLPKAGQALYRGASFEQAELNLFSELMRIALVTDAGGRGLKRAQRIALQQLGTIIDFVEDRGALGSDIDPLRLLRSNLADLMNGDRAPFFKVQRIAPKGKSGRKLFPEYGRALQYFSVLATQAMKDVGACRTIADAARSWARELERYKIRQLDGHEGLASADRAISASLLLKWREEGSDDPSYREIRAQALASAGWPKNAKSAKDFCERTAKRLARMQWWMQRDLAKA